MGRRQAEHPRAFMSARETEISSECELPGRQRTGAVKPRQRQGEGLWRTVWKELIKLRIKCRGPAGPAGRQSPGTGR